MSDKKFSAPSLPLRILLSLLCLRQQPVAALPSLGSLCSSWGGIPGGIPGGMVWCYTFLENGARHPACWHFSYAVSHCKRSIFMEDLQLLSWKILLNSECSVTQAEKTTGLFREYVLGWERRLDRVAELSLGKLLNHKPVEAGRVSSASIAMCLSSYTFLQAVAIACYWNWDPRKAAAVAVLYLLWLASQLAGGTLSHSLFPQSSHGWPKP